MFLVKLYFYRLYKLFLDSQRQPGYIGSTLGGQRVVHPFKKKKLMVEAHVCVCVQFLLNC